MPSVSHFIFVTYFSFHPATRPPRPILPFMFLTTLFHSCLAKEVGALLEEKDWRCLYCKFEEVRLQPLSTIASAFDCFLEDLADGLHCDAYQEIKASIANAFENASVGIEAQHTFFRLIPALREFVSANNVCPEPNETMNTRDADAAKLRLHQLFVLLTRALSNQRRPLFICMDDIQWADTTLLELINVLLEGIEEEGVSRNMLLFGCFRSNQVADSDPLVSCIQQMKACRNVDLTEIQLEGLKSNDVNALVSDSLFYPRRLTRPLSNLIHQKSAGNPLFVKEILNSLATENLLTYSLSKHKWQFDEDLIQLKTISKGVADLLARRLQRLPEGILSGLQVMSCFGHELPSDVLVHVRDVCNNSDITAGLEYATKELLMKKNSNGSYNFAHHVIQHTVHQGIDPQDRVQMLKEIADTLISRTTEARRDDVLFIIVDLINRVGAENTRDEEDRVMYAKFNLAAGEKSIKIPDYASAIVYLEAGISFIDDSYATKNRNLSLELLETTSQAHWALDDDYWTTNYDLSLGLFKNAAHAYWALGKTCLMTQRVNEVSFGLIALLSPQNHDDISHSRTASR